MLNVKRLHRDAILPTVAHPGEDLAYDLYAFEDVALEPFKVTKVHTGIAAAAFEVRTGTGGSIPGIQHPHEVEWWQTTKPMGLLIRDRSSMASKGIIVSAGVVDAGYRGEIIVCLTLIRSVEFLVVDTFIEDDTTSRRIASFDSAFIKRSHYSEGVLYPCQFIQDTPNEIIKAGDKIAQMIPIPVLTGEVKEVEEFDETARGSSGFGSTGR